MSAPQLIFDSPLDQLAQAARQLANAETRIRRRFLESVNGVRRLRSLEEIVELLEAGRTAEAIALGDQLAPLLQAELDAVFVAAGASAAAVVRSQTASLIEFSALSRSALAHIDDTRLRLLRGITAEQRAATGRLLNDAIRRGVRVADQAGVIKGSIGLTDYQAERVLAYRRRLEAGDPASLRAALSAELRDRRTDRTLERLIRGEGAALSPEQIERMAERYQANWLRFRADTIARTESLVAVNGAEDALWDQAFADGVVERGAVVQIWHHNPSSHPRRFHQSMDGQRRLQGVPFESGRGTRLRFPGDPAAPLSETIRCRCTREIRILPTAEAAAEFVSEAA